MCALRKYDRYPALHKAKGATRSTGCCKNILSGWSRVLPSLAALAWTLIAARWAFFEDETKRMGINIGQAEDEKSQAKDEKPDNRGDFLLTNYTSYTDSESTIR